jgi:hypothetical protein
MTFNMLYEAVRNRHKQQHASLHGDLEKPLDVHDTIEPKPVETVKKTASGFSRVCLMFFSEFRFLILTVLVVMSALTLQHTLEDVIDVCVKSKIKSPGVRILWMFFLSTMLILLTITIVIAWKPVQIPAPKPKPQKT